MLRGDAIGAMPLATGSTRRVASQWSGPLLETVRAGQTGAVGARRHVIVPTRP